jgi:aryl-alcohol dehydrogenase-like predicted oxidoreductase
MRIPISTGEHDMLTKRRLGKQGLQFSAIGLGRIGLSPAYGMSSDAEAAATIDRALELGCNLFEAVESYVPHSSEELLGRCVADKRDQVVLAKKVGFAHSRASHIRESVEASLGRLRTDRIDLLYLHRVDPSMPVEDAAGTVGDLIREGKVHYFGLSEASDNTIRRAHAVQPLSAVQGEYSLWERGIEDRILPVLFDLGIGLVPSSPQGRGQLTNPVPRALDRDASPSIADVVRDIAVARDASPAQVALAWVLGVNRSIVPIPGTRRRGCLEENIAACALELTPGEIELLDEISAPQPTVAPRWSTWTTDSSGNYVRADTRH